MKTLICLTVLVSVTSMSMGFDLLGGMAKQATDMMKQGMDIGKQGMEMGTQILSQGMNTGMQVFNQAMNSIPFMDAVQSAQEMVEAAADTATDYQGQLMEVFQQGANEAAKVAEGAAGMAEGAVGQTQQMFMEGMKQIQNLQSMGAPKADYMDLLNKMKGTVNLS